MLSKDRWKTTAGFFVIPLLSRLLEEKIYCERRNELSSWRPVALPNRHIHLYLFKLGYDVHALLSSVMYILSGENITAVFTISRRRWENTTQVANRLMEEDGATIQPKSFWLGRVCHLVYVMVAIPLKSLLPDGKHLSNAGWAERPYSFCPSRTPALHLLY